MARQRRIPVQPAGIDSLSPARFQAWRAAKKRPALTGPAFRDAYWAYRSRRGEPVPGARPPAPPAPGVGGTPGPAAAPGGQSAPPPDPYREYPAWARKYLERTDAQAKHEEDYGKGVSTWLGNALAPLQQAQQQNNQGWAQAVQGMQAPAAGNGMDPQGWRTAAQGDAIRAIGGANAAGQQAAGQLGASQAGYASQGILAGLAERVAQIPRAHNQRKQEYLEQLDRWRAEQEEESRRFNIEQQNSSLGNILEFMQSQGQLDSQMARDLLRQDREDARLNATLGSRERVVGAQIAADQAQSAATGAARSARETQAAAGKTSAAYRKKKQAEIARVAKMLAPSLVADPENPGGFIEKPSVWSDPTRQRQLFRQVLGQGLRPGDALRVLDEAGLTMNPAAAREWLVPLVGWNRARQLLRQIAGHDIGPATGSHKGFRAGRPD